MRWWWAVVLTAPLWPSGTLGSTHGGRLWVVAWLVVGLLCATTVTPCRGLVLAAGLGAFFEAWRWFGADLPWLYQWGAWWATAGWWVLGAAATQAVCQTAPTERHRLAKFAALLLTFGLLWWAVSSSTGWSRWAFPVSADHGLFPSHASWAGASALSLPILWAWSPLAIAPAVLALAVCGSSSAFLALAATWLTWKRRPLREWLGAGLCVGFLSWRYEPLLSVVGLRLATWTAGFQTIAETPSGIGWGMNAFHAVAANANGKVMNHISSDWLLLPLHYGWWTVPVWCAGSWWLWTQPKSPYLAALRIAWFLSAWQASVSLPIVAVWVWACYCAHRKGVVHEETQSPRPVCVG